MVYIQGLQTCSFINIRISLSELCPCQEVFTMTFFRPMFLEGLRDFVFDKNKYVFNTY